jgi:hypothetical protein
MSDTNEIKLAGPNVRRLSVSQYKTNAASEKSNATAHH